MTCLPHFRINWKKEKKEKRKTRWSNHIECSPGIANTILQGTVERTEETKWDKRKKWTDDINDFSALLVHKGHSKMRQNGEKQSPSYHRCPLTSNIKGDMKKWCFTKKVYQSDYRLIKEKQTTPRSLLTLYLCKFVRNIHRNSNIVEIDEIVMSPIERFYCWHKFGSLIFTRKHISTEQFISFNDTELQSSRFQAIRRNCYQKGFSRFSLWSCQLLNNQTFTTDFLKKTF